MNYEESINNEHAIDKFKSSFKYFKQRSPFPDYSKVLEFKDLNKQNWIKPKLWPNADLQASSLGLQCPKNWNIYSLPNHPGLIVISNPFTALGAVGWCKQCIQKFSGFHNETNISRHKFDDHNWWETVQEDLYRNNISKSVRMLHWSTMGFHHNWDTKEYSADFCSPMPEEIETICRFVLRIATDYPIEDFKAEAAIVNYYGASSTLSAHTDHSEPFKEAPLLSFSFGQTGVFLIGGKTKEKEPTAIFLNHGDIMIMTEESRLSYHAVPKIFSMKDLHHWGGNSVVQLYEEYWDDVKRKWMETSNTSEKDFTSIINYLKCFRINLNVRQVMPNK